MFPALFRRELVRQFACFGGQMTAGRFFRVIKLLWRGALRPPHNKLSLPLPAGKCNTFLLLLGVPYGFGT
jgi:hypothetical protein